MRGRGQRPVRGGRGRTGVVDGSLSTCCCRVRRCLQRQLLAPLLPGLPLELALLFALLRQHCEPTLLGQPLLSTLLEALLALGGKLHRDLLCCGELAQQHLASLPQAHYRGLLSCDRCGRCLLGLRRGLFGVSGFGERLLSSRFVDLRELSCRLPGLEPRIERTLGVLIPRHLGDEVVRAIRGQGSVESRQSAASGLLRKHEPGELLTGVRGMRHGAVSASAGIGDRRRGLLPVQQRAVVGLRRLLCSDCQPLELGAGCGKVSLDVAHRTLCVNDPLLRCGDVVLARDDGSLRVRGRGRAQREGEYDGRTDRNRPQGGSRQHRWRPLGSRWRIETAVNDDGREPVALRRYLPSAPIGTSFTQITLVTR